MVVAVVCGGDGGASDGGSSREMGLIYFLKVCVIMSAS